MRASKRLRNASSELIEAAALNPLAANRDELAKMAARALALAWQVELDERSIVKCPNCDTDLPEGCGGIFRSEGDACWLNRTAPTVKSAHTGESNV